MADLGDLSRVSDIRSVWADEVREFLPWLMREVNLHSLGKAVGLVLESVPRHEPHLGRYPCVLCRDAKTNGRVVIIAELDTSSRDALADLVEALAAIQASAVIWVAPAIRDEHRTVLDWLNRITDDWFHAFGVEIELWKIDDSPLAPRFNLVCRPNPWAARWRDLPAAGVTENQRKQEDFWHRFAAYAEKQGYPYGEVVKPRPQNWMPFSVNRSGFFISAVLSTWDTEKADFGGELRVELVLKYRESLAHFEQLEKMKESIEQRIGEPLHWQKRQDINMCRVYVRRPVADPLDSSQWEEHYVWLYDRIMLFQEIFRPIVARLEPAFPLANGDY